MKRIERYAWIGVTILLLLFGSAVASAPHLLADSAPQTREQEVRDYMNRFQFIFQYVLNNYVDEISPEELFEASMQGLFDNLDDPYSYYLTADDLKSFSDTTTGRFGGVGLYIARPSRPEEENVRDKYIRVVAPIEDTPAFRAGIHAADLITKVNGESTTDMTVDEAVDRLRGVPGTDVTVTLLRGKDIVFDVVLTRAVIEIPTVKRDIIPDGIGYIRIIQFSPYTYERVKDAIAYFDEQGYSSLIIDVRGNPGGVLTGVVDTADLFLESGPIVITRSRIPGENRVYSAGRRKTVVDRSIPIALLIDNGSASASEILAGALKDTNRAYLLGANTFGKGSVQQIYPYGQWGFKMTVSRYYSPDNNVIDKIGVAPDTTISEPELSEAENESLKKIIEGNKIVRFVDENPDADEQVIRNFINGLQKEGIVLQDRLFMRLIRNEYNRRVDFPPVYDLDFDMALKEAVRMLKAGEIRPGQ